MIGGEIIAVEPPYVVTIHNLDGRPAPVVVVVEYTEEAIAIVREDWLARHDGSVEVTFEIAGGERARRRAGGEVDPEAVARRAAARTRQEEEMQRLRESLRPYAPFHVSQLRFDGLDDGTPEPNGAPGRGGEP